MRRLDTEFQPRRSSPLAWSLLAVGSAMVAGLVLLQQSLQAEQVEREASVHNWSSNWAVARPPSHR